MASVALGSKTVGSVVKLNVGGVSRNFLVVHQGKPGSMYDASCDGTWLLMQDCYENRQWHSSNVNDYSASTIHSYLNSTFLNLFDANIKAAIKQVKLPYRAGSGYGKTVTSGASGLSARIFLLSSTEVNLVHGYEPTNEGACLSYFTGTAQNGADNKRIAKLNGSAVYWWLRSPYCDSDNGAAYALRVNTSGGWYGGSCSNSYGIRPALILPSSLLVSDDGSVTTNTAPTTPSSITVPQSISGGTTITVSWGASTDAQGNLEGYIVERSTNGGSSWSQVYQGSARQTTNNVPFGTDSVMYRVKAYDTEGLSSGWKTSSQVTVINNTSPGAPPSITVPLTVIGGAALTVSWTASSDSESNLSGYVLERKVGNGAWTQVFKGNALSYQDTITKGWVDVTYRVKAYDSYNAESTYTTSPTRTVDNNTAPAITCSSSGDLGTKSTGFSIPYSVNDVDGDTVTVKELMDDTQKRSFAANLGATNQFQVTGDYFQQLLNGAHSMKIVASDPGGKSATHTLTFTKSVTALSITMNEPMEADALISIMAMSVMGSIPADANYEVLVTNNGKDSDPVWENATDAVKKGANFLFTNKTASNGFAFNFKITASRGSSGVGGFIQSIQGGFQ